MRFENRKGRQKVDLAPETESILVLSGEARHLWIHAIPARKSEMVSDQK